MRAISLRNWLSGLLIALPISYLFLFPELFRCQTVRFSADFRPLAQTPMPVYIQRNTPDSLQKKLIQHITASTTRLHAFWNVKKGSRLAGNATIIFCADPETYNRYCGQKAESSAGCSLGAPWGEAYLILGPDGNNVDVIAHERCHDELLARLGWWTVQRQIPQWFNEGLALMVDYRFSPATHNPRLRYEKLHDEWLFRGQSSQESTDLQEIETMEQFFSGSPYRVLLAYLTSATEVARWLAFSGPDGLPTLMANLDAGESFGVVYKQLDRKRSQHKPNNRPAP
ncbi:hypothetical protein [Arsenicibacter rosenii]|uniref:DUF1570 domain-containing protein n=1 Tax=Arsenicibacter rosenii TaxID=1750698 RepID=A0A1S2VQY4_9BACT|nr:hypothetical protein [Arsenicibacter rosenii]OIN60576.1 hypothetical protein BLX24_00155 [Arsenicibacter rosenii]